MNRVPCQEVKQVQCQSARRESSGIGLQIRGIDMEMIRFFSACENRERDENDERNAPDKMSESSVSGAPCPDNMSEPPIFGMSLGWALAPVILRSPRARRK